MKTTKTSLLLIISFFVIIMSCSEDDLPDVNSEPEFVSLKKSISSIAGEVFTIEGMFSDPAGIKSINIKYEPWSLDRTIVKKDLPKNYNFKYSFKVPNDAVENSQHTIPITVTNTGGVQTTNQVVVTLDDDILAPNVNLISPADGLTVIMGNGDDIIFNLELSDKELSKLKIESTVFNDLVNYSGAPTATYTKGINIDTPGLYEFKFTATDLSGNSIELISKVNVVDELKFINMYLADVDSDAVLNEDLAGIPYETVNSAVVSEDGYVFTVKYYADKANKEVRFVAQKKSFSPFSFGAGAPGKLALGTDASVSPIVLSEAGYYEISMDLRDLSYTASRYTPPAIEPLGGDFLGVFIAGTGLMVGGKQLEGWSPSTSLPFVVDPNNGYRYSQTITFIEGVQGQFIFVGNQENWNKFWRTNKADVKDINSIVPQGGVGAVTNVDDSVYKGKVLVTLDIHLNTFTATKI